MDSSSSESASSTSESSPDPPEMDRTQRSEASSPPPPMQTTQRNDADDDDDEYSARSVPIRGTVGQAASTGNQQLSVIAETWPGREAPGAAATRPPPTAPPFPGLRAIALATERRAAGMQRGFGAAGTFGGGPGRYGGRSVRAMQRAQALSTAKETDVGNMFPWTKTGRGKCMAWLCPLDGVAADDDAECPLCYQRVPPGSLLPCAMCARKVCVVCYLRTCSAAAWQQRIYNDIDLLYGHVRCPFCRDLIKLIRLAQLEDWYQSHVDDVPFRLYPPRPPPPSRQARSLNMRQGFFAQPGMGIGQVAPVTAGAVVGAAGNVQPPAVRVEPTPMAWTSDEEGSEADIEGINVQEQRLLWDVIRREQMRTAGAPPPPLGRPATTFGQVDVHTLDARLQLARGLAPGQLAPLVGSRSGSSVASQGSGAPANSNNTLAMTLSGGFSWTSAPAHPDLIRSLSSDSTVSTAANPSYTEPIEDPAVEAASRSATPGTSVRDPALLQTNSTSSSNASHAFSPLSETPPLPHAPPPSTRADTPPTPVAAPSTSTSNNSTDPNELD